MKPINLTVDRKYSYLIKDLISFTPEALNEVAVEFNEGIVKPNNLYWIEFEAYLLNGANGNKSILIDKTFLHPKQLTYLGEELFRSLEREGLDDLDNKIYYLEFRFKLRDYFQ